MFLTFAGWLEKHQLPCFYHKYLGVECPGCGMQRSIIALLKGDIIGCISAYPALFPIIIMLGFLILHLKFRFEKGGNVLKIMFIFTVSIIMINFIYKLLI